MAEDTFLRALRMAETGTPQGNYAKIQGIVRGGQRKLGAYGIASDDWPQMATDAGYSGARWQDPAAQDAVARATVARLFTKYGDWRLVGIAWRAGEAIADLVSADPSLLENEHLAPVKEYASHLMSLAVSEERLSPQPAMVGAADPAVSTAFDPDMGSLAGLASVPEPVGDDLDDELLRRRLYAMRDRARNQVTALPDEDDAVTFESQGGTA